MNILLTAGPTREAIDPVRFLTNRSSGRMGYELAAAFARLEHRVLLISGPTSLDVPEGVDFVPVESAAEMYDSVAHFLPGMDVAVFAAAVADYTPAHPAEGKIKKTAEVLQLELVRTRDILGSARAPIGFAGTLVGFAAETSDLEAAARAKQTAKRCDLVIANDVSRRDIGFDSDHNEVLLVYPDHTEHLPRASKHDLAHELAERILLLHTRHHPTP